MSSIFWFRRDLRLQDNIALNKAVSQGRVYPVTFIAKDALSEMSSLRQHSTVASIESLRESLNGKLLVRAVSTEADIPAALVALCETHAVDTVFATAAHDTDGRSLQHSVAEALAAANRSLQVSDSYYAVTPGLVRKPTDGAPYRVFTPFYRAWQEHGWSRPATLPSSAEFELIGPSDPIPNLSPIPQPVLAGEAYALATLRRFRSQRELGYAENRNRPDLGGTSQLSHALAHGEIHPRTILNAIGDSKGSEVFKSEIAWREFYADVLWHNPGTVVDYYDPKFKMLEYNDPKDSIEAFDAWKHGKTGYPIVDAGMRQLQQTGWMHNRVRMIVASFLVKDLHLEWQLGAKWFEQHLTDFDPASNSHGWQWTAGCGTDASPYYRIFNPTLQGLKYDPAGDYVRRFIPELAHIPGAAVHEPWLLIDGLTNGYPAPIVSHEAERNESLRRLEALKVALAKP